MERLIGNIILIQIFMITLSFKKTADPICVQRGRVDRELCDARS